MQVVREVSQRTPAFATLHSVGGAWMPAAALSKEAGAASVRDMVAERLLLPSQILFASALAILGIDDFEVGG